MPREGYGAGQLAIYNDSTALATKDGGFAISTNCEDIESAMKILAWFYCDSGYEICNYGWIEGETYYVEDGQKYINDFMQERSSYGYVVVSPGCRGRDNQRPDGTYYGKAPAAIVYLKAAVRFHRHNRDTIPGNPEHIISSGGSAGGALSSLLGASGNHPDYAPYLREIGAADERDDILAAVGFSPIINLEHADSAYEWEMGPIPCGGESSVSKPSSARASKTPRTVPYR